ncbi:hypothetical protein B0H17DRAFT_1140804 [Mycena rosella]|uniref:Uncharacterized protein n=1 Tax=Mycena rosella TaxID=1033263 RepID=A0AAD7D101_MYCRO|nr:hypothetical protein B0H17DRAFT_1140804 [Mycena rosella]
MRHKFQAKNLHVLPQRIAHWSWLISPNCVLTDESRLRNMMSKYLSSAPDFEMKAPAWMMASSRYQSALTMDNVSLRQSPKLCGKNVEVTTCQKNHRKIPSFSGAFSRTKIWYLTLRALHRTPVLCWVMWRLEIEQIKERHHSGFIIGISERARIRRALAGAASLFSLSLFTAKRREAGTARDHTLIAEDHSRALVYRLNMTGMRWIGSRAARRATKQCVLDCRAPPRRTRATWYSRFGDSVRRCPLNRSEDRIRELSARQALGDGLSAHVARPTWGARQSNVHRFVARLARVLTLPGVRASIIGPAAWYTETNLKVSRKKEARDSGRHGTNKEIEQRRASARLIMVLLLDLFNLQAST